MGELSFRACTGTVCVFHVCDQARDNTSQLTAERQLPCRSRGQRSCCAILGSSHTSHLEHTKYFLPSCCWNDYLIFWLKWINCSSYLSSEKVFSIFGCVCTSQWALENILFFLFLCCKPPLSPYLPLHYLSPCPSTEPLIYGANNSCDDFISDWRLIFSLAYADRTRTAHIAVNQVRGSTSGRGLGGGSDREMRRK